MRRREKDVALVMAARGRTSKNSKLAPKKIPELLPGQVEARMVKCGKQGCKCSRGELHGPYFYHRTWDQNKRLKTYIRLSDVTRTVLACKLHRDFQAELREGRAEYKRTLAQSRALLRMLSL